MSTTETFSPLRRRIVLGIAASPLIGWRPLWKQRDDPLSSWNDTPPRRAILAFIAAVTQRGGARYVPPEQRVATFDNDGTLWCEKPTIEVVYTKERVASLLAQRPELAHEHPYDVLASNDPNALSTLTAADVLHVFADTHTGMTEETFATQVRQFFATARHPTYGVPYTQVAYQPQLELLALLRANGFRVFICSGGEISFMRTVSQSIYGVPPENVIGTTFVDKTTERDGKQVLERTSQLSLLNDKDGKPVGIQQHIGQRPIFTCGNERSGGDIAMLRYTRANTLPSLSLLVNHDDATREALYAEKDGASLAAAARYGFTVISMKSDWKSVFSFA